MKYLLLFLLFPFTALADTPREAFEGMHQCLLREANSCSDYFTGDSQALYEKVVKYDLSRCVPQQASYLSEMKIGAVTMVRVKVNKKGEEQTARLAFSKEGERYKINLPETLRRGLGEKWQTYVNATETAYVFMQQQLKQPLSCEAVEALAPAAEAKN